MILPKFILGDNSEFPEAIFVQNDEVEWLEEFDKEDQKELEDETETAIEEASKFYDNEVAQYKND